MAVIISVNSVKGGSLKSTNTINLAASFAKLGYRTLVVDLDAQGNASMYLGKGVKNSELTMANVLIPKSQETKNIMKTTIDKVIVPVKKNLYLAPADLNLINIPNKIDQEMLKETILRKILKTDVINQIFDIVLIDNSPSLDILVTNALATADYVIASATFEFSALKGIQYLMEPINLVRENINDSLKFLGTIAGKFNNTKHAKEVKSILESEKYNLLGTLSTSIAVSEATVEGKAIVDADPKHKISSEYMEIAKKIVDLMIEDGRLKRKESD